MEMSILVQSLKRLYTKNKVTLTKLNDMVVNQKLTQDEYTYITS